MCMFSRSVAFVGGTKIFARADGDREVLAYAMRFEAAEELAMVLPIPVAPGAPEDAVRFVDLSSYPALFAWLDTAFPDEQFQLLSLGAPQSRHAGKALVVHDVGDFEASFVPTVRDFGRLDERFRLPDAVWAKLPIYASYGFVVAKLKVPKTGLLGGLFAKPPARKDIHPLAFSFPRADTTRLFFPTLHVHDGDVHATAHFDHTLYVQAAETPRGIGEHWAATAKPLGEHFDVTPSKGVLIATERAFRRTLAGDTRNDDTWACW